MTGYTGVPQDLEDGRRHRQMIAAALNGVLAGRMNAGDVVTLRAGETTTALIDPRLHPAAFLAFDPMTAAAAAELAAGGMFVAEDDRGRGDWIITHADAASADRRFRYIVIG